MGSFPRGAVKELFQIEQGQVREATVTVTPGVGVPEVAAVVDRPCLIAVLPVAFGVQV